jgi:hypothetical protein
LGVGIEERNILVGQTHADFHTLILPGVFFCSIIIVLLPVHSGFEEPATNTPMGCAWTDGALTVGHRLNRGTNLTTPCS